MAMANLAALRAAVFSLSAKNRTEAPYGQINPPAGARVKVVYQCTNFKSIAQFLTPKWSVFVSEKNTHS